MLAIPLLEEVYWFLGFLVFGFLIFGFLVSWLLVLWFLGLLVSKLFVFLISKFLGFLVSKFQSLKDSMIPYYQKSISRFQEEVDLISKIFKMLLNGSSGFSGAHHLQDFQHLDVRHSENNKNNIDRK